MSRIEVPELVEFRRLVADRMAAMGYPMYEDDEGSLMVKIDGLMDALITATLQVAFSSVVDEAGDAPEGEA